MWSSVLIYYELRPTQPPTFAGLESEYKLT